MEEGGGIQRRLLEIIHKLDWSAQSRGGLSKIICPNENNNTEETEIVKVCLKENERWFTQSNVKTSRQSHMRAEMGLTGKGESGDKIIEGTYSIPKGVNKSVQCVLSNLKGVGNIKLRKKPVPITCEQHKIG